MAVYVQTQSILTVAEISQYLSQQEINNNINLGHGDVNVEYSRLLYCVREAVQWAFDQNPSDETLNVTAQYLLSLCGRYYNRAIVIADNEDCSVPVILVQPTDQSGDEGDTLTFTVIAASVATITYKWYINGVLNAEDTNILTIMSADAATFSIYVKAVTPCGSITSSTVTATFGTVVTNPEIYFGTNETGVTPIESAILAGDSVATDPLDDVTVNYGTQSATPVYYWIAIPNTGAAAEKDHWYESVLNQGAMGGVSDLFGASATVDVDGQDYFVWITQYATQFTEDDYIFSQ